MAKRYGKKQSPLHLDDKELKTSLGTGNYIFVCSGCDLFSAGIEYRWLSSVIFHTMKFPENQYLWHTKNPVMYEFLFFPFQHKNNILCTTIETDMGDSREISSAPGWGERLDTLRNMNCRKMITVEPIMKFSADFAEKLIACNPEQINIGADSGRNNLLEPTREKVEELLVLLAPHTKIHLKKNLRRILPESRHYGESR
jgi:hypothetical protein